MQLLLIIFNCHMGQPTPPRVSFTGVGKGGGGGEASWLHPQEISTLYYIIVKLCSEEMQGICAPSFQIDGIIMLLHKQHGTLNIFVVVTYTTV